MYLFYILNLKLALLTTIVALLLVTLVAVTNNTTDLIDFKRNKLDIPAVVERLEYDRNRSTNSC